MSKYIPAWQTLERIEAEARRREAAIKREVIAEKRKGAVEKVGMELCHHNSTRPCVECKKTSKRIVDAILGEE